MHLAELVAFLLNWRDANPNGSKKVLAAEVLARTDLKLDKALLVGKHCVLRISQMQEVGNDSSAVAAFRKIEEYDDRPIVVCLFTSRGMRLLLGGIDRYAFDLLRRGRLGQREQGREQQRKRPRTAASWCSHAGGLHGVVGARVTGINQHGSGGRRQKADIGGGDCANTWAEKTNERVHGILIGLGA